MSFPTQIATRAFCGLILTTFALTSFVAVGGCPYNAGHFNRPTYDYNPMKPPPKRARVLRWLHERVCEVEYLRHGDRHTWRVYLLGTTPQGPETPEPKPEQVPEWADYGRIPPADMQLLGIMEGLFPAGCEVEISYPLARGL